MKQNKAKLVAVRYIGKPIGNCMTVSLVGKGAPSGITIQQGCFGLIDVANPWSMLMGDYWYGCWIIKDKAGRAWGGYKSVRTDDVMPIWPNLIKPHEMRLLLRAHMAAKKPC